ncbi:MAG: leucine-rich repeat domain-containing protein, partial [Muribaculaceae bacterium]|nr:leucine-rich repeat domain-containing protein [Muribaculaceae bacterium]
FSSCQNLTSVEIPNSVTKIGNSAFSSCNSLTYVEIPNSVKTIGEHVFDRCSSLISVEIPNSVTTIEKYAFFLCSNLISVRIPNSVKTIGSSAFKDCSGMTSVEIPNSITTIEEEAFSGCSRLISVYYAADDPIEALSSVFDYTTYTNGTLYVPEAAIEKCKQIYPWLRFSNIQSLDFNRVDDATADLEETLPVYIYDLNGIMVGNDTKSLPSGVYIVRHGNKAKKISVN